MEDPLYEVQSTRQLAGLRLVRLLTFEGQSNTGKNCQIEEVHGQFESVLNTAVATQTENQQPVR